MRCPATTSDKSAAHEATDAGDAATAATGCAAAAASCATAATGRRRSATNSSACHAFAEASKSTAATFLPASTTLLNVREEIISICLAHVDLI